MFNKTDKAFIIAEVGQNHQGDLELARKYVKIFSAEGADAIKFQTRNNRYLFDNASYIAPYASENAFAETYGEHRELLELKPEWLAILKQDCKEHGVQFMSTPFDEPSLLLLKKLDVDILKVASFDLGNLPFINRISKLNKPVVMSIGEGKIEQIRSSVEILKRNCNDIAILHCVSEYPCEFDRLGLDNIITLKSEFPDFVIGSSDHFNGTLSGPVAYMKGARVFEKHVTLNRAWRGTDHSFALEREGFRKFVRDINRVSEMMRPKAEVELGTEKVFTKLGKSLIVNEDLRVDDIFTLENLSGKIFSKQYTPVRDSNLFIGKKVGKDIKKGEPIMRSDIFQYE
jgi:sialic acid synthase